MGNLYKRLIFTHYRHPQNFGSMEKPTFSIEGANPFCGDTITIELKVGKNGLIKDVKWIGKGCTISLASASIFSELIKGKTLDEVKTMENEVLLKHIPEILSPTRMKCALLPLYTIKSL